MKFRKIDLKCIAVSILLHLLFFYNSLNQTAQNNPNNGKKHGGDGSRIIPKVNRVEVSIFEKNSKNCTSKKEVIKKIERKNGFYGIGVYTQTYATEQISYNGQIYMGLLITGVVEGYPAAQNGLKAGDVIFLVDDQIVTDGHNITNTKPTVVKLAIYSSGRIIFMKIKREWIETEPKRQ